MSVLRLAYRRAKSSDIRRAVPEERPIPRYGVPSSSIQSTESPSQRSVADAVQGGGQQEMNMNIHNTSLPTRLGPDELVPSRYAVRVGEIDVLVISDGILSLPTRMLAHDTDPAVRAAWLDDMLLPPEMIDWPLNVVVVC